jgi:uncharacterized protein YegL
MSSRFKDFTVSTARPLPVLLLADVSGSMSVDGKIEALNAAIAEMLGTFAAEDEIRGEIHLGVITFGGNGAALELPLRPARDIVWRELACGGQTPMAEAFLLARDILENRTMVPSRAYTPTLVLVSDGKPTMTDRKIDWGDALSSLLTSARASKAMRLAVGIGADVDAEAVQVLRSFVADPAIPVFRADEARQVMSFFRWVTMSVTNRVRSADPNTVQPAALVTLRPSDLAQFD